VQFEDLCFAVQILQGEDKEHDLKIIYIVIFVLAFYLELYTGMYLCECVKYTVL